MRNKSNKGAQKQLKALEKSEIKECQSYTRAQTAQLHLIDLNLFRVFDVMMHHRRLCKASQILSVTPSAISHALNRLRQSIGDELFIPGESGMQPTQRALELASAVREAFEKLELALTGKGVAMSIATKTGDSGKTTLMYGRRLPKNDQRVEAYGTVDELKAALGLVRATAEPELIQRTVLAVQKELVFLMEELAVADEDRDRYQHDGYELVTGAMVDRLTAIVYDLEQNHHLFFKHWATPGDALDASALDLARTVCRRAERRLVGLAQSLKYVNSESIRYLNRLSDLLWLLARYAKSDTGGGGTT